MRLPKKPKFWAHLREVWCWPKWVRVEVPQELIEPEASPNYVWAGWRCVRCGTIAYTSARQSPSPTGVRSVRISATLDDEGGAS